jgi:hypothetical protein
MAKKQTKRGPAKGVKYRKDPREKLTSGEKWTITLDIDKDAGLKILDQHDTAPPGTQYQYLINKALRKGLGLKQAK